MVKKFDKDKILSILKRVIDPELGGNIVDLGLIDKVSEEKGKPVIEFHLSNFFVPLIFATNLMEEMKKELQRHRIDAKLVATDHRHAKELNQYFERIPIK